MLLSSLSPELIGLILTYDCVLHSAIPLWITGNKLLQRQLALGVTDVYLENGLEYSLYCVPSCIKEFRHLRKFAIDRAGARILFPSSATSTIRSLAPTLKKLVLDFRGNIKILFPNYVEPTEDEAADPTPSDALSKCSLDADQPSQSTSSWSLKAAFPQLECLDLGPAVWTLDMVEQLPPTLTKILTIKQSNPDVFRAVFNALPPHIEHVCFGRLPIPETDILGLLSHRNLTALNWIFSGDGYSEPESIAALPRTLTDVATDHLILNPKFRPLVDRVLTQAAVDALPPALTTLPFISSAKTLRFLASTPKIAPNALNFSHLKELRMLASEDDPGPLMSVATIKSLPPKLHTLNMSADLEGIAKTDWPPLLRYLEWTPSSPNFSLEALPSNITTLLIQEPTFSVPSKMIGILPRTIQRLRFTCHPFEAGDIDFPSRLTFLNMLCDGDECTWVAVEPFKLMVDDGESKDEIDFELNDSMHLDQLDARPKVVSCFPFHCLPGELEDLYLPCCIPASQLVHLPPLLESLYVPDIIEDADFDANDPKLLTRMRELAAAGFKEDGIVTPPSHLSLPASRASLLPRTLGTISTKACNFFRDCDWPRFPPHLTSITGESDLRMPATLLKEAPFSRVSILNLCLDGLTEETIKLLPQTLTVLCNNFEAISAINLPESCLLYLPCELPGAILPEELREAWERLQEKRFEAIDSSSITDIGALFPYSYLNTLYAE